MATVIFIGFMLLKFGFPFPDETVEAGSVTLCFALIYDALTVVGRFKK